jgi:class 3 adenylate cyclase
MSIQVKEIVAILFTDLVGYSALTQKDEALALELLNLHHTQMTPILKRFKGTIIKTIGDAFMVKFEDPLDAVNCAIRMQQEIAEGNRKEKKARRLKMRVGIHYGEVVVRDNDIFGDAVNIAARLEPQAKAEQICISEEVYKSVKREVTVVIKSIGKKPLKNISAPVQLYMVNPHRKPSFFNHLKWPILIYMGVYVYRLAVSDYSHILENINQSSKDALVQFQKIGKEDYKEEKEYKSSLDKLEESELDPYAAPAKKELSFSDKMQDVGRRYEFYKEKNNSPSENLAARFDELNRLYQDGNKETFNLRETEFSKSLEIEIKSLGEDI